MESNDTLVQAKQAVTASSLPSSRKAHLQRALELAHGHVFHAHDDGHSLANLMELITLSAGGSLGMMPGCDVPSLPSVGLGERASCHAECVANCHRATLSQGQSAIVYFFEWLLMNGLCVSYLWLDLFLPGIAKLLISSQADLSISISGS